MTELTFRSNMTVELVRSMGDDTSVVQAARVSTVGANDPEEGEGAGLIRFLIKNKHGTPLEHNAFTFRIEAPIFVAREFMRHRIGTSINEESGRYKSLKPIFYLPAWNRPLVQVGKVGQYRFEKGSNNQKDQTKYALHNIAHLSYDWYEELLELGVAREVARMVLPVSIYTSWYCTMNARSLMHFLGLRTQHENATFPSYPMEEIRMVADQMEELWAEKMPLTHAAFDENGRVAP